MFQFPGFALCGLCIQPQSTCVTRLLCATASLLERANSRSTIASLLERIARIVPPFHTITVYQVGFPIRTSMDQGLFTAPHGLSQCTTSFIASCCQGIHQTPFSRLIRSGKSTARPPAAFATGRKAPSSGRKSTFPGSGLVRPEAMVSVLDLDRHAPRRSSPGKTPECRPMPPHAGTSALTDVFSLNDVNRSGPVFGPGASEPDDRRHRTGGADDRVRRKGQGRRAGRDPQGLHPQGLPRARALGIKS